MTLQPTDLEAALLRLFYEAHQAGGFPPPEQIRILERENTGLGRFLTLEAEAVLTAARAILQIDYFVVLPNVESMGAVVVVQHHRLDELELYSNAPLQEDWDGDESGWTLDPINRLTHSKGAARFPWRKFWHK